ncbi:MAG: glycosyltransferase family 4 protein [Candidatus Bathyarchaeia archaeon]
MRILFVHPRIFAGGAEKAIVHLAHQLERLGHEVAVCTISAKLEELPPIAKQVYYIVPEKPVQSSRLDSSTMAVRSIVAEIATFLSLIQNCCDDFDVLSPCNFPAYWSTCAYRDRRPIVWISSEVFGPYGASRDLYDKSMIFRMATQALAILDKYVVKRSVDKIVTCSELNRNLIWERYGLDATVIPTAVDYQFFSADGSGEKEDLGLEDSYVLLHVGSLIKRKNQILSIRALHQLKRMIANVKLVLVGEGPWELILRDEVRRLALDKDVIFTGRISEEELRDLYHICDANIFPVVEQTYGLVPFEALAAGKLSLVSQNSGAGMLMKDFGIGYPITPDVQSIVNGVLELWKYSECFEESIAKGRAYVRENLTWERYAAEMADVYEAVCNS